MHLYNRSFRITTLTLLCPSTIGKTEQSRRRSKWYRNGDSVQGPQRNAREWEMEDKKSKRGRDDRMRKLTEGDGGSWVNLSSKSSQSRPIPISALPRQESFSPWPCLLLCLWRKDGARLSMIGDGHYLNTIFEPGPTPLATAVRLETTLMRRKMMGHPATPSPFINSDKMVSTLSWNAQQPPSTSINIDFFTKCHSVHLSTHLSSPYFSHIGNLYSVRIISNPALNTQQPYVNLFNILSVPFVCLAEGSLCEWLVFVLANLLLFRRLSSVGQWRDWQDLKMFCAALLCPSPAGWDEWGLLTESVGRATREGVSGGTSYPQTEHAPLYMQMNPKDPPVPLERIVPKKKIPVSS